jgi:hypothetical protein
MFNTFSQHTKERRRSGFEEFLNIITALDPIPPEMEDFLELEEHNSNPRDRNTDIRPHSQVEAQHIEQSDKTSNSLTGTFSDRSVTESETSTISSIPLNSHLDPSLPSGEEKKLREKVQKQLLFILTSTFIFTTIAYAICIYSGLVDIRNSSLGKCNYIFIDLDSNTIFVLYQHTLLLNLIYHILLLSKSAPMYVWNPSEFVESIVMTAVSMGSSITLLRISRLKSKLKAEQKRMK